MRNKLFFILTLTLAFGLSNTSAQTPAKPKSITGGVLNGKAASLPKPAFPAAARAVGASGAVNVQVTIDENGDVISAEAISGHPLLRQASEQAARASKFAPTLLEGQPVRVTGVIVYNFVQPMTLNQIGYELSLAENSRSIHKYQINSIAGDIPKNWEEVTEALKNLDSRLTLKLVKEENPEQTSPQINANVGKVNPPNASYQGNTRVGIATKIAREGIGEHPLDNEAVALVKELQSKIESRLSDNERAVWSFRLGRIAGKLKAGIESIEKTRANLSELNALGANIPSGVSISVSTKIKEIIESAQQITPEVERKEKLLTLVETLRNFRTY